MITGSGIASGSTISLRGNFSSFNITQSGLAIALESGSITTVEIGSAALNTSISMAAGTTVQSLTADGPVTITGTGQIVTAHINVDGVNIAATPANAILASGVIAVINGATINSSGGSSNGDISSFSAIAPVNGGYIEAPVYADAAAVQSYLNTVYGSVYAEVTGGGTIEVPVTAWVDTDSYTPTTAGSYTFTAILGTIPNDYSNTGNYTATAEVIVGSVGDYTYNITSGKATITNYTGSDCMIFIPDTLGGAPVTAIGDSSFAGLTWLTSVFIPSSITIIGAFAFDGCDDLTSIAIPDSVTSIGDYAFTYCSGLTSITIPDGVTSIGGGAFAGCSSLTSVTIPDGVTSIADYAFAYCSGLTSITIPDSVTSIGYSAFAYCSSLTGIIVDGNNTAYCSLDGVIYNLDKTELIAYPAGAGLTNFTIPDSVTSIADYAFSGCSSLTSIAIPDSVTSIGDWAFSNCSSLTSITIPDSVTSIGVSAFYSCSDLTIYGHSGSYAETYANNHSINFEAL